VEKRSKWAGIVIEKRIQITKTMLTISKVKEDQNAWVIHPKYCLTQLQHLEMHWQEVACKKK